MEKVYIAGKITGDPEYRMKFGRAARALEMTGNVVLNPATLPNGLNQADYMHICFAMLDCADRAVFLTDWNESEGAMLEQAYCAKTGKPVAFLAGV